jgi:hypothetical protein
MDAPSLGGLPTEVLERIAFFVCTREPVGPPDILPLLRACKAVHEQLAPSRNPALYSDVFRAKFDTAAIRRRLGPWEPSSSALRDELVRRFAALRRIRTGAARGKYPVDDSPSPFVAEQGDERDLWTLLLILLEDDGLNVRQARGYGQAHEWLSAYWIRALRVTVPQQAESTHASISRPWIPDTGRNALAMWSFWILLRPGTRSTFFSPCNRMLTKATSSDDQDPQIRDILRILALAGHRVRRCSVHPAPRSRTDFMQYSLVSPPWQEFKQHSRPIRSPSVLPEYLGYPGLMLSPPPLSAPVVCSFYGMENMPRARRRASDLPLIHSTDPLAPALPSATPRTAGGSREWDTEFNRLVRLGDLRTTRQGETSLLASNGVLSRGPATMTNDGVRAFRPGSLHGVWEGMFMVRTSPRGYRGARCDALQYTEFQTYASLLMGASWNAIERVDFGQHRQTWRLREHHLLALAADPEGPAGADSEEQTGPPLPAGEPLNAHLPQPLLLVEESGGKLKLFHEGREHVYDTWAGEGYVAAEAVPEGRVRCVRDVILTGEVRCAALLRRLPLIVTCRDTLRGANSPFAVGCGHLMDTSLSSSATQTAGSEATGCTGRSSSATSTGTSRVAGERP